VGVFGESIPFMREVDLGRMIKQIILCFQDRIGSHLGQENDSFPNGV